MARQTIADTSGDTGWLALTPVYGTGIGAYGGTYGPWYKKFADGRVLLSGLVKVTATTATATLMTLPVGLRIVTGGGAEEYMPISVYYGSYTAQASYWYPNGNVVVANYTATVGYWYSLGGISYYTS